MRVIYKYALDRIPKQDAQNLFKNYTIFEKKFGDRRGIEDIIVSKRRFQYEEEVKVRVTGTFQAHCTASCCSRYREDFVISSLRSFTSPLEASPKKTPRESSF